MRCPRCGFGNPPEREACRYCGALLVEPSTVPVDTHPLPIPVERPSKRIFSEEEEGVLLEFFPLGQYLFVPLEGSLILGRDAITSPLPNADTASEKVVDLARYGAQAFGVSRQHCRLQRRDIQLLVIDLNSSNFTYLNGERLTAHRPYVLAHGDHLFLGRMHLIVYFGADSPA